MQITNEHVYAIEESIVASGLPMETGIHDPLKFICEVGELLGWDWIAGAEDETAKHIKRAQKLGQVEIGKGDDNYLKGIIVQMNVTAPQYFWPQLQRYHFNDIVSSQSKMHRIVEFNIDEMCNKFVARNVIESLNNYISLYNNFDKDGLNLPIKLRDGSEIPYTKENLFKIIISNCPMGLEVTARVTTNYQQLKTQYFQRRNHRLDEWSQVFCTWVEGLPKFRQLILGEGVGQ